MIIDAETTHASGTAEVDAAWTMLDRRPGKRRLTVGADKNYDQQRFVEGARAARVTPGAGDRPSTNAPRTTRHAGYAQSINARHRVETPFGWGKYARPLKQTMLRGLGRVGAQAKRVFARYNLVRIDALEAA